MKQKQHHSANAENSTLICSQLSHETFGFKQKGLHAYNERRICMGILTVFCSELSSIQWLFLGMRHSRADSAAGSTSAHLASPPDHSMKMEARDGYNALVAGVNICIALGAGHWSRPSSLPLSFGAPNWLFVNGNGVVMYFSALHRHASSMSSIILLEST